MSTTAKVIQIVASSENSFEDAIREGLKEAAKTLHDITGIKVVEMTAKVQGDRITTYKVTMDLVFAIERK